MQVIKKIKALSVAKVSGIMTTGVYLVIGVVINLISFAFQIPVLKQLDFLGLASGLLASLLAALVAGILAFAVGGLWAVVYNLVSKYVGGVEVEFIEVEAQKSSSAFAFLSKSKELE